jgi:prepilin-type N-terminal cleavage/methylation domain-containing protein
MRSGQSGFTILELMIATMVFSVILLVVAAGILSFTKQYIKGITSSNTQTVARAVMADVVQNIQFSSGTVRHNALLNPEQYCVGNVAYYVVKGQKVTVTQHGLVQEVGSCSATGITLGPLGTLSSTQHEMLSQNMRIAEFSIDQPNSSSTSATVTVTVVSGDYDMFTDKNGTVLTSEAAAPSASFDWGSVHCRSGAGSQFCGVSRLTTFVQGRIGS